MMQDISVNLIFLETTVILIASRVPQTSIMQLNKSLPTRISGDSLNLDNLVSSKDRSSVLKQDTMSNGIPDNDIQSFENNLMIKRHGGYSR
jgi:hypothetical protein